jgi:hypothetical protein
VSEARRGTRGTVASRHRDRRRLQPTVLNLEDRKLLSTFTVDSTGDTGSGSGTSGDLRYCINQANSDAQANTIVFSSSVFATEQQITLSLGQLTLSDKSRLQTITGPSAGVVISGNDASRVLQIDKGVKATISGLTITHGRTPAGGFTSDGGGVLNHGTLSLSGCTFSYDYSGFNGGGIENEGPSLTLKNTILELDDARLSGGGLANDGTTVTITGGQIAGNEAFLSGGGIHNTNQMTVTGVSFIHNISGDDGGAVSNRGNGNLTMVNCSVSGNVASGTPVTGYFLYPANGVGGAISSAKTLTLTGCSLYDNSGGNGGGLYVTGTTTAVDCTIWQNTGASGGGMANTGTATLTADTFNGNHANASGGGIVNANTVNIEDTILAGDSASVADPEFDGTAASLGQNLVAETDGSSGWVGSDLQGTVATPLNALLAAPGSYGGPTSTVALLPGSPAINAGIAASGVTQDQRGDPLDTPTPDIGAFQSHGFTATIVVATRSEESAQVAPTGSAFSNPLAVTVQANDSVEPVAGGVVTFTPPSSGASATLSSGTATIGSSGVASVTATANLAYGDYAVTASAAGVKTPVNFELGNAHLNGQWSGYAAETSLSNPQANSVTYVSGSWTVPRVTATSANTYSATWVGIDGFNNDTVEQTGTSQDYYNGQPVYYAWWEMFSTIGGQPEQRITTMTVSPGDKITASVTYETSGTQAGDFLLSINDTSHANDSFSIYANPATYQNPLPVRSTAEWIMEAPMVGGIAPLANFGKVAFTNCSVTINGVNGGINNSNWQSTPLDIADGSGNLQAVTGGLNSAGNNFSVTFETSNGTILGAGNAGVATAAQSVVGETTTLTAPTQQKKLGVGPQASLWAGASSRMRFSTRIARPKGPGSTFLWIG